MTDKGKEEKWFEVVNFFDSEQRKVFEHKGNQVFLCGDINGVVIIQVNEVYGNETATIARLEAAQKIMTQIGIEKGIIVTDSVKFMKLREVEDSSLISKLDAGKNESLH